MYKIPQLEGGSYIPNYLKEEQVGDLVTKILSVPKFKEWKLYHPGPVMSGYDLDEIPDFIMPIIEQLLEEGIIPKKPFQINLNLYTPPNYCIVVRIACPYWQNMLKNDKAAFEIRFNNV
eukprot:TRINITY_DN3343_c0_g1_i1.p1 TRINITY_DN3343_c0_g1~~TRINITY_DN3343_c0_g1_i1.p1  ORF type:complete len:119 (-),score=11.47 TRINITY_DN3343_c0_g1_i1:474-830(-)